MINVLNLYELIIGNNMLFGEDDTLYLVGINNYCIHEYRLLRMMGNDAIYDTGVVTPYLRHRYRNSLPTTPVS